MDVKEPLGKNSQLEGNLRSENRRSQGKKRKRKNSGFKYSSETSKDFDSQKQSRKRQKLTIEDVIVNCYRHIVDSIRDGIYVNKDREGFATIVANFTGINQSKVNRVIADFRKGRRKINTSNTIDSKSSAGAPYPTSSTE